MLSESVRSIFAVFAWESRLGSKADAVPNMNRLRSILLIGALLTGEFSLSMTSADCKAIEDWIMAPFDENAYRRSLCFDSFVIEKGGNPSCANMPNAELDQYGIAFHDLSLRKAHEASLGEYAAEVAQCFDKTLARKRYGLERSVTSELRDREFTISWKSGAICYTSMPDSRGCLEVSAARARSPLHDAVLNRDQHRIKELIRQGANVNIQDEKGWTPLFTAIGNDYSELVEFLLEHGSNVDSTTLENATPLHLAASYGRLTAVKLLVRHGALLDAKTNHGATSLHVAIAYHNCEVVKLLVDEGADIHLQDGYGETPIEFGSNLGRCSDLLSD